MLDLILATLSLKKVANRLLNVFKGWPDGRGGAPLYKYKDNVFNKLVLKGNGHYW